MKAVLLDINVLIALLWPSHSHHNRAVEWFDRNRTRRWATCPIVQAGFVRIVSNPAFSRDAVTPPQAMRLLERNTAAHDHQFWTDEIPFTEAVTVFGERLVGHQQATDAYLWGLAIYKGGMLATLDAAIATLTEGRSPLRKSLEILEY